MAMEVNSDAVTVSVVEPVTVPEVAEIVSVPVLRVVARPPVVMLARLVLLEAHVAEAVRFCVLPSE